MTCIVALRTATSIAIAGDSLTLSGERITSRATKKYVSLPGSWVIANSGLSSFRGLLTEAAREKKLSLDGDVYSLCGSIRAYLKEVGYVPSPHSGVGLPGYDLGIAIINTGVPSVPCPGSPPLQGKDRWFNPPAIWIASGGDIWPKEMEIDRPYGLGSGESHGEAGAWVALKTGWGALSSVRHGVEAAIEYDLNSGGEIWSMEIAL